MRTIVAALLVLMLGGIAVYAQTDGFAVLTTESARRTRIAQQPLDLPAAHVQSAHGDSQVLATNLAKDGRVAIVNFMFTRCTSVCIQMGDEFQQLQEAIKERGLQDKVRLISISFDPRDTPDWLGRYHKRMRTDESVWQAMLASHDQERRGLLEAFGIIVVPAPLGQFEHNTAYHVVTPDGRLTRIVDIDNPDIVLHYAATQAGWQPGGSPAGKGAS